MAKSLRSKWKRKMRAIKRVRYGEKELAKLKMVVENVKNADVEMNGESSLVNFVENGRPCRIARRAYSLGVRPPPPEPEHKLITSDEIMETDEKKEVTKNIPLWLGSHRRKKLVQLNKKLKKEKKKEIKKAKKKQR